MNHKLTFIILMLMAIIHQVHGQNSKNIISIHLGVGHIARQDLVFSPLIHKDITPLNVGLEYTRNANFHHNIKLRFASFDPMLAGSYEYFENGETEVTSPHFFSLVDFDYSLGKEIRKTERYKFRIGALLATDVQVLNYTYGRIGSFGYYANFGLGGFFSTEYALSEKSGISVRLALPLFNWLSRSPYMVNDDEFIENISSHANMKTFFAFVQDGEFATLNTLQTFDLETQYIYRIHARWDIGLGYFLEFIHSKEPRNLLSYRNSLFASANFKF